MTSSRDKSIKSLVNGCRKGNKRDWAELIGRVAPVIFSACYRFRLSRGESFDVFGKVSLLLLEHIDDLKEVGRLFGYVSTIAHREAMAVNAHSRLFHRAVREHSSEPAIEDATLQIHRNLEMEHELRLMADAFREMPARCQELLRMLFLEQKKVTYRDVSQRLGIPISSIGPTRLRCLKKLRVLMIEKGYEE
jgi:RNA polymerase sigma factor (sigma-70 family)